jgi:hypothetical protein
MSDNWLQFIPTDPNFQPSLESAERARALLATYLPRAQDVRASFKDAVEFFHPGGNWSGVECPACGADAEPWWQLAMAQASQTGFASLNVQAPCCAAQVSLNELRYIWPAAFGRFMLQAMNPGVEDLEPVQGARLTETLGHSLRKVWVHL